MPHVDEGLLHAWLDGGLHAMSDAGELPDGMTAADVETHIRACADCRALLEQERAIRERAGLVLRDATLSTIDAPPFELIARQAPAVRRRTWLPLTWAASLLLAVGAGWWGSVLWRSDPTARMQSADAPAAAPESAMLHRSTDVARTLDEPTAPAAADNIAADVSQPAGEAVGDRTAAGAAGRAMPAGAETAAAPLAAPPPPATDAEKLAVAPAPVPSAPPPPPPDAAGTRSGETPQVLRRVTPDSLFVDTRAAAALRERAAAVQAQDQLVTQAAAQRPLGAPIPAFAADTPPARITVVPEALAHFRESVRRAHAGELEWVPQRLDDLQRSGTPALLVAGASPPRVDAALGARPGRLVRVQQRLESGEEVQLLLWRIAAAAGDAAEVVPGAPPRIEQLRRRVEEPGAAPQSLAVTIITQIELADGRREVVALVPALGVYVAASARLDDAALRNVVQRLVQLR